MRTYGDAMAPGEVEGPSDVLRLCGALRDVVARGDDNLGQTRRKVRREAVLWQWVLTAKIESAP
jgi:hypothetical protein